jgi:hypothetical protein
MGIINLNKVSHCSDHKDMYGSRDIAAHILNLSIRWRLVVSFKKLFFPWCKGHPCITHCVGGCVGSRTNVDVSEKEKISFW